MLVLRIAVKRCAQELSCRQKDTDLPLTVQPPKLRVLTLAAKSRQHLLQNRCAPCSECFQQARTMVGMPGVMCSWWSAMYNIWEHATTHCSRQRNPCRTSVSPERQAFDLLHGVFPKIGGPQYSTRNSRILIIRTQNTVPLIFRKLPHDQQGVQSFQGFLLSKEGVPEALKFLG